MDAAVAQLVAQTGPPDAAVTSAGYQGAFVTTAASPVDDLRTVLEVNVVGTFTVMRACAAALIPAGRPGAMVAVASMAGVSGPPNMPAYAASKAAVLGLTRSAAKPCPQRNPRQRRQPCVHRVRGDGGPAGRGAGSGVEPYYADTPQEAAAQMIGQVPLGRYGTVDEVSSVVAFLLSDEAAYLTGTNTEVSGGAA